MTTCSLEIICAARHHTIKEVFNSFDDDYSNVSGRLRRRAKHLHDEHLASGGGDGVLCIEYCLQQSRSYTLTAKFTSATDLLTAGRRVLHTSELAQSTPSGPRTNANQNVSTNTSIKRVEQAANASQNVSTQHSAPATQTLSAAQTSTTSSVPCVRPPQVTNAAISASSTDDATDPPSKIVVLKTSQPQKVVAQGEDDMVDQKHAPSDHEGSATKNVEETDDDMPLSKKRKRGNYGAADHAEELAVVRPGIRAQLRGIAVLREQAGIPRTTFDIQAALKPALKNAVHRRRIIYE